MIIKPRVTEFNHRGTECTEDERTENYWGAVEGEPVCGKDHAALAKQLQIRVLSLALPELSGWAFLLGAGGHR